MKFKSFCLALLIVSSLSSLPAFSQGPGNPGPDPDPVDVPFDGGISLLIAAGIGLGAKKAYDRKKKLEQEEASKSGN